MTRRLSDGSTVDDWVKSVPREPDDLDRLVDQVVARTTVGSEVEEPADDDDR